MAEDKPIIPKKVKTPPLSVVEKSTLETMLGVLNEEYAVILRGSQVLIMRHWIGEDRASKLIFLNKRDFLLLQENNKLWTKDADGNGKPIKIGQAWLEWTKRKGYEEMYFEPCGPKYEKRYNLWRDFAFKPKKSCDVSKFSIFLDHVKTNICQSNEEHYAWVMAWLADLFQKPGRKLGTALVLRGPMGVGKGAFAGHIGRLLGIHFMPITQSSQLTGKFNGHMADKLLMFVDEGWWSDERNGAGILRALITETQVTIEMKGRDAITIPNFTRFIIAANADWVVPLGMGDERRFLMLDVGTLAQRNNQYFKEMQAQMDSGGYEELLTYLLQYQYDEALPRSIIQTAALCDNKIYSMSDEAKWWHECLIKERIGDFRINESRDNEIECIKFYEHYQKWCDGMKIKPIAYNILPKKLKDMIEFNKNRRLTFDEREYFYDLPYLSRMREKFEGFLGYKIDWDEA